MTSRQAPAATRALRVLGFLASRPEPSTLDAIARAVEMPRSSAYHLVNAMIGEGFVTHLRDEHRFALGVAAFEVGSGYTRQAPLQRLARRPLADLVDAVGESAHLAVLHGRDVLYVLEERAPGRPPLVSDVGVRLPAQVTASGRAILARLSRPQLRALFPDRAAFVTRHGSGPGSLSDLQSLLADVRRRGHGTEDGDVTPGLASVAFAVTDHVGYPVAAVAVTFESRPDLVPADVTRRAQDTAAGLTRTLGGAPVPPPPPDRVVAPR
ncbi:MAG: IclR family transcriptional regulator [Propionibacteriales bacterium]|nr:IclR family transcriptional regulator [Propionibacteriales bacterium]